MVPIKKGPNMKLKSFIIFPIHPPFVSHHLKGTATEHIPVTRTEEAIATGINLWKDFLGRKTTDIQGNISNINLTMFGIPLSHNIITSH
jgi:hypothetical protein